MPKNFLCCSFKLLKEKTSELANLVVALNQRLCACMRGLEQCFGLGLGCCGLKTSRDG